MRGRETHSYLSEHDPRRHGSRPDKAHSGAPSEQRKVRQRTLPRCRRVWSALRVRRIKSEKGVGTGQIKKGQEVLALESLRQRGPEASKVDPGILYPPLRALPLPLPQTPPRPLPGEPRRLVLSSALRPPPLVLRRPAGVTNEITSAAPRLPTGAGRFPTRMRSSPASPANCRQDSAVS